MDVGNLLGIGDFWINLVSLLIALFSVGFGLWTYFKSRQRKLITYEFEDKDTNVVSIDRDKGEDVKIFLDGDQVEEVRYQLIKIRNEGNVGIDDKDYQEPLQIVFEPKKDDANKSRALTTKSSQIILRAGIPEAAPALGIDRHNAKDYIILDIKNQYVALKDVLLNGGEWIKIKVLTLGKADITIKGRMKDGKIKQFAPVQRFFTWRNIFGYVVLGALFFFLLYNSVGLITAFIQGACVPGSIEVKGSSAFYGTATAYANNYHTTCPVGFIHIDQDSSGSGLLDLKNGTIQVANSETSSSAAGLASTRFEDHRVAVIVFTIVINKDVTGVVSLTRTQILKIYNGSYQNWKDVDSHAPDIPIRVFGRPTTSGTHATFTRYVLGAEARSAPSYQDVDRTDLMAQTVAQTPGAIGYVDEGTAGRLSSQISSVEIDQEAPTHALVENNTYPFWAIEHMYTKKDPDKIVSSFITYVVSSVETNDTFIKLQDMSKSALQTRE